MSSGGATLTDGDPHSELVADKDGLIAAGATNCLVDGHSVGLPPAAPNRPYINSHVIFTLQLLALVVITMMLMMMTMMI